MAGLESLIISHWVPGGSPSTLIELSSCLGATSTAGKGSDEDSRDSPGQDLLEGTCGKARPCT